MAGSEDSDDLEYHVTFPTPTPGSDQNEEFRTIEGLLQNRETAVMMIGWMNSQDRHLAKYSKIYEDLGCVTVRYSPTTKDVLGGKAGQTVAKKLLEVLVEMSLSDNPVLFHIFSNGGCAIYSAMREELQTNPYFEDICKLGVVYDSAPGQLRLSQVAAVFSNNNLGMWTNLLKMGSFVFGALAYGISKIFSLFGITVRQTTYDKMLYYQDGCPELYLFSKADELVMAADIEYMIERRQMQGVDISVVCWDDSPHVQHLKVHRETYMKQCSDFLKKCVTLSIECDASDSDT